MIKKNLNEHDLIDKLIFTTQDNILLMEGKPKEKGQGESVRVDILMFLHQIIPKPLNYIHASVQFAI